MTFSRGMERRICDQFVVIEGREGKATVFMAPAVHGPRKC